MTMTESEIVEKAKRITKIWEDGFINIFSMICSRPDEVFYWALKNSDALLYSASQVYFKCVKDGSASKLEHLPVEKKKVLWNKAKELRKDEKHRLHVCQALYMREVIR